ERLAQGRLEAESEARRDVVHERDQAQRRLYDARVAQAQARRWSGRAGRRFESLKALAQAAKLARDLDLGPEEILKLRNETIACMALSDLRLDGQPRESSPPGSGPPTCVALDADVERYARFESDGSVTVRALADNKVILRITDTAAPARRPSDWRS